MTHHFQVPTEWKSEKWWNNRSEEERLFHLRIPRRWESVDADLPPEVDRWLTDYQPGDSLYLVGPSGSGKTTIAATVAKRLIKRGHSGRFVNSEKYLEMLKDSFEYDGLLPEMYSMPYLIRYIQGVFSFIVLDAMGSERETEFANHEIGSLLRRRNEDMRTVIVTSHLGVTDATRRYGDRINGPLRDMKVVRV
jgi:DNA replication protein DnaC